MAAQVREKALAELATAEKYYNDAMRYKEDFWEGMCSLGQVEMDRAKLAAGVMAKPVPAGCGAAVRFRSGVGRLSM
jgi:hypothetical protein